MPSCSTVQLMMNKDAFFLPSKQVLFLTDDHSSSVFRLGLRREDTAMQNPKSTKNQAVLVPANSNGSPRKGSSSKEIIMVDPMEAKRLAAKQMERIKAKERFKGSPRKGSSSKEIIMVDPMEAKRLAAKQMERIKAKERFKRQRQIEAINGAWAMIGLTVGLLIEARNGHRILAQR